jgi:transposase
VEGFKRKGIKIFMNTKLSFILVLALLFSVKLFAQDDVVTLIINGKKVGERTVTENSSVINVNKTKYKKISDLTVRVKQATVNKIYKRTLQITDENESLLFTVQEQKTKIGLFKINLTKTRQQLLRQHVIKAYLAEDPANSMMKILSKRQLLAELHFR